MVDVSGLQPSARAYLDSLWPLVELDARVKLHDYQVAAVAHLHRQPRAGLFLDMGLGKTAITLSALTADHLPALVIAPKRVAENVWGHEAELWRPDLSIAIADGPPIRRRQVLTSHRDIIVLGRDNLGDIDTLVRDVPFRTVILDELSGFKSRSSVRWKLARRLTTKRPYVWGLTGTPSPNGLMDLWAQLFLLDGGERLGKTLTAFRGRYFMPGRQIASGVVVEWNLRPEADKAIHGLIDDICLSMTSEGRISLPPVTFNTIEVPLGPGARSLYKTMKRDLLVDFEMIGGEIHTATNAAVLTSKLSQLAAGFMLVDDADLRAGAYDVVHHDKVNAVKEIVEGTGSPVLVFYRFRAELEMLKNALTGLAHTIDEPGVIDRWNAGEIPVLLAHPAAAGHGLNLQHGGHTIVWSSLSWSLEEWEQGNKRVSRQGQKHPVVIHLVVSPRTVDEAIRARLVDKATVQNALMAHLESPL